MKSSQELVTFIARSLVDHPEDVVVTLEQGEQGPFLRLQVHPDELGKVIGRQGRIAKAIRTVLSASTSKSHQHLGLEIVD